MNLEVIDIDDMISAFGTKIVGTPFQLLCRGKLLFF